MKILFLNFDIISANINKLSYPTINTIGFFYKVVYTCKKIKFNYFLTLKIILLEIKCNI